MFSRLLGGIAEIVIPSMVTHWLNSTGPYTTKPPLTEGKTKDSSLHDHAITDSLERTGKELEEKHDEIDKLKKSLALSKAELIAKKKELLQLTSPLKETVQAESKDFHEPETLVVKMRETLDPIIKNLSKQINDAKTNDDYLGACDIATELADQLERFIVLEKNIIAKLPTIGACANFAVVSVEKTIEEKAQLTQPLPVIKVSETIDNVIWLKHAKAFNDLNSIFTTVTADIIAVNQKVNEYLLQSKKVEDNNADTAKKLSSDAAISKKLALPNPPLASEEKLSPEQTTLSNEPIFFGPFGGTLSQKDLEQLNVLMDSSNYNNIIEDNILKLRF